MIKKEYNIYGLVGNTEKFLKELEYNFIKFNTSISYRSCSFNGGLSEGRFVDINISDDMVKEVDDLVQELAKNSGVSLDY